MEARDRLVLARCLREPPRRGESVGEGALLRGELDGPIANPSGFAQHDRRAGPEKVGDQPLLALEPRQPRLHSLEQLARREAFPGSPPPGRLRDQGLRPRSGRVGREDLPASIEQDAVDLLDGPLVGGIEDGQAVDLVAPQIDPHGEIRGGGKDVDDPAPDRQLAPMLDLVLPAVAQRHEPLHQRRGVELRSGRYGDRARNPLAVGQRLKERPHGRNHHRGRI